MEAATETRRMLKAENVVEVDEASGVGRRGLDSRSSAILRLRNTR